MKLFYRIFNKIFRVFYQIRVWPIQILYVFSSKKFVQSPFLNSLGIQGLRIKLADSQLIRKRKKLNTEPEKQTWLDDLQTNGIVVLPNAINSEHLEKAKKMLRAYLEKNKIADRSVNHSELINSGTEFFHIPLNAMPPEFPSIFGRQLLYAENTVEHYLGAKSVADWYIKVVSDNDADKEPGGDTNCHSDTFHSTLKAWVYLDDVPKDGPTLKFFKRTHLMSENLLKLHIDISKIDTSRSPRVQKKLISDLDYELFDCDIKAGTLIIADTRGFHYRNWAPNYSQARSTVYASFRSNPFY